MQWQLGRAELLEDGLFHWLVPAFVIGRCSVDDIVDQAVEVVEREAPVSWLVRGSVAERESVEREIEKILDVVARCSLFEREEARIDINRHTGREQHRGGELVITELGYEVSVRRPIAEHDAAELLELLGDGMVLDGVGEALPDDQAVEAIARMWRIDLPETLVVLEAIAAVHPLKPVVKAARKATMQHRTKYQC